MAVSTAPAVKAALLAQLKDRHGLNGVGMDWSPPVDASRYRREHIYLGDVSQTQEYRRLGTMLPKDEHYDLIVYVQVLRAGDFPQATEERCWELVGEVENQLREDPTVNSTITPAHDDPYAQFIKAVMTVRPAEPQGWLAKATVTVAVGARI